MSIYQTLFEVAGAALSAGAAGFGFYKAYKAHRRRRSNARHVGALVAVQEIANNLNAILWDTAVERVMLLKCENGGGIPSPGQQRYSSIMLEVHDGCLSGIRGRWQRVLLDQYYHDMLLTIYRDGATKLSVQDMPEDCLLYPMYTSAGVARSYVFLVGVTEKEMFYLVLNQVHEIDLVGEGLIVVRQSLSKITEALGQFEDFVHTPGPFPADKLH
jgi:hypothetical protein